MYGYKTVYFQISNNYKIGKDSNNLKILRVNFIFGCMERNFNPLSYFETRSSFAYNFIGNISYY